MSCPDVELLHALVVFFGVPVERLLTGDFDPNNTGKENVRKLEFHLCPDCRNLLTATGAAEVGCCGRKLKSMITYSADADHGVCVEPVEED